MNKVPPEGSLQSAIAFVGEAPSWAEIAAGRPFVGPAGGVFETCLRSARIIRADCYITNVFKDMIHKTSNNVYEIDGVEVYSDRKGFTEAGLPHFSAIIEELMQGDFNIIVPMGNPALAAVLELSGITKYRGSKMYSKALNKKVIPMIHPAAALRVYMYRHFIIADLMKIKRESISDELSFEERKYLTLPNFTEAKTWLNGFLNHEVDKVACDIEVVRGEVSCISFAESPKNAIVIPFHYKGMPYYTIGQEAELWQLIGQVLEDDKINKIGQNFIFDTTFLYEKYGIITRNYDDTMVAHRMMFPDYPAGLDFITSMYTDIAYYKDDGKQYFKWGGNEDDFLLYNAKDSIVCMEAMPQLEIGLQRINNYDPYKEQLKLFPILTYMGLRGLRVDVDGLNKKKEETEKQLNEAQEKLNEIVGTPLNANSPKQVATYFYTHKNIKPYKLKGKTTTNDGAMKRIARRGYPEASIILSLRHMRKMIGTYYDVTLYNNRLRCSYDPAKKTGRIGSAEDIFGYGTNLQNQPRDMDEFFIADEGHLLFNVDLSQADNRSVAYIAPEPNMIHAFESGTDVHALTASLIFFKDEKHVEEIIQMDKEGVKADIGYGDQTHRYWGKKCNHSLNYGMYYVKFAYTLELPENEGKELWVAYHDAYPGIQHTFHKWVRNMLSTNNRTLTNCFGRKYVFKDRWGNDLFNQAYAFIPQSNTADVINRQGLIPFYYDEEFQPVDLLRQVHDSINFQIEVGLGALGISQILERMKASLEQPLTWRGRQFAIPAEFKVGYNLKDMTKLNFDDNLISQIEEIIHEPWNRLFSSFSRT